MNTQNLYKRIMVMDKKEKKQYKYAYCTNIVVENACNFNIKLLLFYIFILQQYYHKDMDECRWFFSYYSLPNWVHRVGILLSMIEIWIINRKQASRNFIFHSFSNSIYFTFSFHWIWRENYILNKHPRHFWLCVDPSGQNNCCKLE